MKKENTCSVGSLSEYIAAIEKYDLFNHISRGESAMYEHPLRSGIHRKNFEIYSEMLEQYHLDVEMSINQTQDKNFIAFAQHHGIPTNLLDFSFSPLVSLYFSMDGCKDKGYVYFINKSKMVSINNVIYERPLGWGLFEELLEFESDLYKKVLPQMSEAFIANREEMVTFFEKHAEEFIDEFRRIRAPGFLESLEGGVDEFEKALEQYRSDRIKWIADERINEDPTLQMYRSVSTFLQGMQKIYKGDLHYPTLFFQNFGKVSNTVINGAEYSANIFVMMFLLKMEEIEYCYERCSRKKLDFELEFPFYFTYRPPIIDERVKNQSSVFVFQPFSTNRMHCEGKPVQVWQKIVPDFTIEVQNPENIRKELDAIGFNLKHIYCDYDSIAKYTVSSLE